MAEIKFMAKDAERVSSGCCEGLSQMVAVPAEAPQGEVYRRAPAWTTGTHMSGAGPVLKVSTGLTQTDWWEHVKCRISAFRNNYMVNPGLYAVGEPDAGADVFVSANYKLSFDHLRIALKDLNAWILVLDTKGINVWCAAGKGTFVTSELVKRISAARLGRVIDHRRIIVPQLGAPGIAAHVVMRATGFKVSYGPVRAEDIPAYIASGYKASREMRTISFAVTDRLILTPMEINPAMKKHYPWFALMILAIFGLQPSGIIFRDAWSGGLPLLILGLVSVFAGAFLTPVFLPVIPFRAFAAKGWIVGLLATFVASCLPRSFEPQETTLLIFSYLFFPLASSYIALQFTGSTTFTCMSGVKKELKLAIPLYISGVFASLILLIMYKLHEWKIV